ncbi:MAG: hypothetical protein ACLFVJ_23295 [Persicimonas sp.]
MLIWLGIIAGVALVGFIVVNGLQSSTIDAAAAHAQKTGNLAPLLAAIESKSESDHPTHIDHAIGELWQAYAREEAARFVVEIAERSDADIIQYWIKRIGEVEPAIAEEVFTEEFLAEHYRPEVASRCGRTGCCG